MSVVVSIGRLCNQLVRNLSVSFIAEKFNLFVNYTSYDLIKELGINLFVGEKKFDEDIFLTEANYFSILNSNNFDKNIIAKNYYQTREITNLINNYLHRDDIKDNIIKSNPFRERYNNNNDLFFHIRLEDATNFNAGSKFYLSFLNKISFDKLFIGTDEKNHLIIKEISEAYPDAIILEYKEVKTIQFASTCKNIVLSSGTFSAIIGYLAFFSTVYYPKIKIKWHGDIFTEKGFIEVDF